MAFRFPKTTFKVKNPNTNFILFDKVSISTKAHQILSKILDENPDIHSLLKNADSDIEAIESMKRWTQEKIDKSPQLKSYLLTGDKTNNLFQQLSWQDYGILRLWDYNSHAGRVFKDLNLNNEYIISHPIRQLWLAVKKGKGGAETGFFIDMYKLFRQINGKDKAITPNKGQLQQWMKAHYSGLDPEIIKIREENKERIIRIIIKKLDQGTLHSRRYFFDDDISSDEKYNQVKQWWSEKNFHLRFAVRDPKTLNEYLDYSLNFETMQILQKAHKQGIPFFINLYYLSLLNVGGTGKYAGLDQVIRDYIIPSKELVEEFGSIQAWEKEDKVEAGKPNAAGWILPEGQNIHRRYPEVAILIPDTIGRACGGLCVSCQRMYDFQNGRFNFNLEKLKPKESWPKKLKRLLNYFEEDKYLKDILITGGDALMSVDRSLQNILNSVLEMAIRKREKNKLLAKSEQKAEIKRIRLGTRLPVYLPQRITEELCSLLKDFRIRAKQHGIDQFVIQTHFQTAMEVTPESKKAIEMLLSTGWLISNQLVFTTAASQRGHISTLRQVLNDLGVLTYYTFSVKGFTENYHNFATNARIVQEKIEEKSLGKPSKEAMRELKSMIDEPQMLSKALHAIRKKYQLPFLATDRNVLNMPGVGKSLSFRTIGLTRFGRRILEFEYDTTREHSPLIDENRKIVIIESKSIHEYLNQLDEMGEDINDYSSIYGYSCSETEKLPDIWDLSKMI